MSFYPNHITRCQHLKINGTQCGSPSLRETKYCYFHIRYHWPELQEIKNNSEWHFSLPTLEDANSIQVALSKIMERLLLSEIDPKIAGLLLYALQTASMNLKHTSLEPEPTHVIIDRESVAHRPLGTSAWSKVEGREYDDLAAESDESENPDAPQKYLPEPPPAARPS